jgi:hypothetical protein
MLQRRLNYSFRSRLPLVNPIIPTRWAHTTKSGGNSELTMEDATALTSHKKSAADEMISTDVPMIAKIHSDLL